MGNQRTEKKLGWGTIGLGLATIVTGNPLFALGTLVSTIVWGIEKGSFSDEENERFLDSVYGGNSFSRHRELNKTALRDTTSGALHTRYPYESKVQVVERRNSYGQVIGYEVRFK